MVLTECDLWVIPPAAHSQWFSRIDWYLNWQLCKGLAYQRQKPSVELFRVMEDAGIKLTVTPEFKGTPLMVASKGRVAADKCVVVEFGKSLKTWLGEIHQLAANMHPARMRVFLPAGSECGEALGLWQKLPALKTEIEFTPDEATTT